MSNKWFARGAFSLMDWHENIGPSAVQNPTRYRHDRRPGGPRSDRATRARSVDGGQIAPRSGGSGKGDIFFNARWQFVLNALYQLPGNFEVGTSLFGRQGYVYPVVLRLDAGGDGAIRTLAESTIDAQRYENLWDVDFRLANNLKLGGRTTLRHHRRPVQRVQQREDPRAQPPGELRRLWFADGRALSADPPYRASVRLLVFRSSLRCRKRPRGTPPGPFAFPAILRAL